VLGIPNTTIRVRAPDAPAPGFEAVGNTDKEGYLILSGAPVGVPLEMVFDIQGKGITSERFTLPADKGVTVEAKARMQWVGPLEAVFDKVPAGPQAYLVQVQLDGQRVRSLPFQMVADRGLVVPLKVGVPRIQVTFELTAVVDDEYLAVQGGIAVLNASWAPWAGPTGGLRLPAPRGAKGLGVRDEDKPFVAVDGDSFRMLRPVPPSAAVFTAGWSMQSDDGEIHWDWPLPMGAVQGSIDIRLHGSKMRVELPPGAKGRAVNDKGTKWFTIRPITIPAERRMIFDVKGMPVRPTWQWVAKLGVGLAVLLLVGAGVFFAVFGTSKKPAGPSIEEQKRRRRRIDELLDQVAALDRGDEGADPSRRGALVKELEGLYKEERAA
jgi:hypothetical protein